MGNDREKIIPTNMQKELNINSVLSADIIPSVNSVHYFTPKRVKNCLLKEEYFLLLYRQILVNEEKMSFEISKAHSLLATGMGERAVRQELIASNIANIDTPFYKARDIDFETALSQKAREVFGVDDTKKLQMAKTDSKHLSGYSELDNKKSTIYLRDGQTQRNDGNTVDLDVETTELSKNAIMYNALTAALKKDSLIFKSVLDASAKV